jgi:phospholipid/cholesterol/gamma-HCH transport system substrate-binding protein
MTRRPRLRAVLAAGAAAATVSSCGLSLQSLPKIGALGGPTYTVTARFTNVVNLPADAEVRIGSFQVGQVSSIGLQNFQAVVKMRIKDSVKLPVGTTASIAFDTPLGEDYVVLTPPSSLTTTSAGAPASAAGGSGPYLGNGSTLSQVGQPAPSVEDTFAALGALLNGGGIDQLQTIISQTDLALEGNQPQIRSLLNELSSTVGTLAGDTPAIDQALQSIATLSTTLEQGSSTIDTGLRALGPAASILAGETQDLDSLFANLSSLSGAANSVIDASLTGSIDTFEQLGPLLDQLVEVQGQLQPALEAVSALETYTPRAIPGDYLQLAINATIDVPPVPSDAQTLQRITVDPPDPQQAYNFKGADASVALLIGWGLP